MSSSGKKQVKIESQESVDKREKHEDWEEGYSDRIYQGALSSASRLSQIEQKKSKDADLLSGIEMMATYKTHDQ